MDAPMTPVPIHPIRVSAETEEGDVSVMTTALMRTMEA